MTEDLKKTGYLVMYVLTFIFVFCILPLIAILQNNSLVDGSRVQCDEPLLVTEILFENRGGSEFRNSYMLEDGSTFRTTQFYEVGSEVCKAV